MPSAIVLAAAADLSGLINLLFPCLHSPNLALTARGVILHATNGHYSNCLRVLDLENGAGRGRHHLKQGRGMQMRPESEQIELELCFSRILSVSLATSIKRIYLNRRKETEWGE